jgi:hypothetical protein
MPTSQWLQKPQSARLLSLSSVIMLGLAIFLAGFYLLSTTKMLLLFLNSVLFRTFCGLVGLVAAPAGIYLLFGKLWYWVQLDHSPRSRKTLWFFSFLLTGFLGLALYCQTRL